MQARHIVHGLIWQEMAYITVRARARLTPAANQIASSEGRKAEFLVVIKACRKKQRVGRC